MALSFGVCHRKKTYLFIRNYNVPGTAFVVPDEKPQLRIITTHKWEIGRRRKSSAYLLSNYARTTSCRVGCFFANRARCWLLAAAGVRVISHLVGIDARKRWTFCWSDFRVMHRSEEKHIHSQYITFTSIVQFTALTHHSSVSLKIVQEHILVAITTSQSK